MVHGIGFDYHFKEMDNKKHKDILLRIADNLLDKDVEAIKFYYSQQIGYGHLERIKTPIELIQTLEQCMLLEIDNYDDFVEVLKKIRRNDLANHFSKTPGSPEITSRFSANKVPSNPPDTDNKFCVKKGNYSLKLTIIMRKGI
ncbi:uncharacterized protein LOC136075830 [Hydra vulgaris]|uniref:Uncharacterized protein LOC136075830 n=1 Tax=Hydra vulgaris TaxID=6087 RepID=A0ABM4B8Z3_HYDVU